MPATDDRYGEAAIRQRQQLHFERTPLAIIEWDLDFQVSEWNPAAERIFGYSRDEALGRHAAGLIVPAIAREHVDRIWRDLCTKRGGLRSTNENNRKDGSIILCEWYNTPLVDERGLVLGVASLVQDVTEQRRAEAALRASEEDLRITLDAIAEAVLSTDAVGRIVRMNPVAERLTGRTTAQVIGLPIDDVIRLVETRTDGQEGPALHIAGVEPEGARGEAVLLAWDGRRFEISWTRSPIRDDEGELVGLVLVLRDETDKRALERQVRRIQHLDALGQLAGGVAHDFNNMLTGIQGFAQMILQELADPPRPATPRDLREFAEGIEQAAATAADLTAKLLAFSRTGRSSFPTVDVHQIIDHALGLLRRSIDRRISIVTRLDATRTAVSGDAAQLQSAILNLGINARDAMPSGGVLTISTRDAVLDPARCSESPFELRPGPYICIEVTDTGTGMTPEVMDRMFEPFFSTKEAGKGTGLGLAALYGTIREHGGSVTAKSQAGVGSQFVLELPTVRATATTKDEVEPQERRSGCLLVVDDEPVVRRVTKAMAQRLGYDVLEACDGEEGLAVYLANKSRIDVVVLDIVMPHMNGRDCFRAIRAADPAANVILCSGFPRDTSIPELFEEGLRDYVTKPFTLEILGRALQAAMAGAMPQPED